MSCGTPVLLRESPDLRLAGLRAEPCLDFVYDLTTGLWLTTPTTPGLIPVDPVITIACEETKSAALTPTSVSSGFRTTSIVTNKGYKARRFFFYANDEGVYTVTVSNNLFAPFITVVRTAGLKWQVTGTVLSFFVTLTQTGPMILEVTSLNPLTLGAFDVTLNCPATETPQALVPHLFPGTVGYDYSSIYGPRVSATILDNLIHRVAYVAIPDMTGLTTPFIWNVDVLPDGLSLVDTDPSDNQAEIVGTPTVSGTFVCSFTATYGAVTVASGTFSIFVDNPLSIAPSSWVPGLWTPTGVFNNEFIWTEDLGIYTGAQGANDIAAVFGYSTNNDGSVWVLPPFLHTDAQIYLTKGRFSPLDQYVLYFSSDVLFGDNYDLFWTRNDPSFLGNYTYDAGTSGPKPSWAPTIITVS